MNKTGVIAESFPRMLNYDYNLVCGTTSTEFPKEYEIPKENTGFLRDQKYEDCVANVIAQISESFWNKELETDEKYSEYFAYGALRKDTSVSPGMITSVAMEMWNKIGIIPQKYFDISAEMPEIKNIVNKYPELVDMAHKYRIKGYVQFKSSNKDIEIKDALTRYKRGLVAVSPKGFSVGSHCIMLTGWNDNTGKYKFKNSWGEKYGDNGFSEIDKSKIGDVYMPIFEEVILPFTDVKDTDWFSKSVKNVYFSGLMKGTSETTFEPEKAVTRAEIATMFDRQTHSNDERFLILQKLIEEKFALLEEKFKK